VPAFYRVPLESTLRRIFLGVTKVRGAVSTHLFMSVLVFMLGAHLRTPRGPLGVDASAAICYSNVALYICLGVGGWNPKCETRCNAGPPGIPSSREASPTWPVGIVSGEKISVDSVVSIRSAVSLFPPPSIFSIKRRIYLRLSPLLSPNFTRVCVLFPQLGARAPCAEVSSRWISADA